MDTYGNVSYQPVKHVDKTFLITAVCLMATIIITGMIGNLLVILAVRTTRKLQTVSNMFIVNLSICDLLFVTSVLPFNIYSYVSDGWFLSPKLCKFVGFLGYTLTGTTLSNITLIAWNRYKLITDFSGYQQWFTTRKTALLIVTSWLFPVVCLFPALLEVWGRFGYVAMMVTCNLLLNHESQSFKVFLLFLRAVVPCILIGICYFLIYRTTKKSRCRLDLSGNSVDMSPSSQNHLRHEIRLTSMMAAIFVVFVLSYFPCSITGIIDWNTVLSKNFHMFCQITVYIGSAVNPVLYGLMNPEYRLAYVRLITCRKHRRPVKTDYDGRTKPSVGIISEQADLLGVDYPASQSKTSSQDSATQALTVSEK